MTSTDPAPGPGAHALVTGASSGLWGRRRQRLPGQGLLRTLVLDAIEQAWASRSGGALQD